MRDTRVQETAQIPSEQPPAGAGGDSRAATEPSTDVDQGPRDKFRPFSDDHG